jgi:hypothetical protein
LIDTWRYATPGDHGFTWTAAPHVAATFEPGARIDYVFIGPPGAAGQGHVVSAGLPSESATPMLRRSSSPDRVFRPEQGRSRLVSPLAG